MKQNLGRIATALIVAATPSTAMAVDSSALAGVTSALVASGMEESPETSRSATGVDQWPGDADRAAGAATMEQNATSGMRVGDDVNAGGVFASGKEGIPVVSEVTFRTTGYISDSFTPFGEVIDGTFSAQNLFSAPDDVVYISRGEKDGVKIGDQFAVVHAGNPVSDPETGDKLGVILYLDGIVEVTDTAADTSEAIITHSYNTIERGDALVRHEIRNVPTVDPDAPVVDKKVTARIVTGYGPQNEYASGDVIFLNGGSSKGISVGDVFDIKGEEKVTRRDGSVVDGLPKFRARARVFDTQARTSSALIVHSISSVARGDLATFALAR